MKNWAPVLFATLIICGCLNFGYLVSTLLIGTTFARSLPNWSAGQLTLLITILLPPILAALCGRVALLGLRRMLQKDLRLAAVFGSLVWYGLSTYHQLRTQGHISWGNIVVTTHAGGQAVRHEYPFVGFALVVLAMAAVVWMAWRMTGEGRTRRDSKGGRGGPGETATA